ncbi:hypothetical protein JCM11491_001098 [Sporobolomyces phaffii]
MQHLHVPSRAAPSASDRDDPDVDTAAPVSARIEGVLTRRSNLEALVAVHHSTLDANDHATMHTPLVDPQGFPRSDIDVAAVRNARVHLIRLRNDLKQLDHDLDRLVQEGLALQSTEGDSDDASEPAPVRDAAPPVRVPFAKVNSVAPDSPARLAGLEADDLVVSIASIDSTNHSDLAAVGQLVARSEGKDVPVVVQRAGGKRVVLKLVPKSGWGGRGLLGCHIVPYP